MLAQPQSRFLRTSEVAEELGVHVTFVRRLIKRGDLSAVVIGEKKQRIERTELERFIAARTRRRMSPQEAG